jgi:hypothetical protein
MAGVLVLSSSALTDRILVHGKVLSSLNRECAVLTWACSAENPRFAEMWLDSGVQVEGFPRVLPMKYFPHNYLRRLNDFAWDFYLMDPSRLSMLHHIRDAAQSWDVYSLRYPGRALARFGMHQWLEDRLEKMIVSYDRSPEAHQRLQALNLNLVLSTGTFRYEEPGVVAAAKRLKIPTLAFITSWDNISIKSRMVLKYDGYLVWSQRMREELLEYYPHSREVPVYVVGAPQFDVFFDQSRHMSRAEFCAGLGMDPGKPVIVHAMGVANNVEEHHGALDLAKRICAGDLGDVQLIVRPHPFHNQKELSQLFAPFAPRVVLQQSDPKEHRRLRSQDQQEIDIWLNTFRHADVVVHLSSTVAIDAALFDRPSVCMDYDPTPGQPHQAIVRDVNHRWTHYKPVAESGGTRLVNNTEELVNAVRAYLADPGLHRAERRRMAEYVCGYLDGQCGERMVNAVLDFLNRHKSKAETPSELYVRA